VFLIAATPVLSVVCEIDCEAVPAASTCHEAQSAPEEQTLRGIHGCEYAHSTGPALQASANARDAVGTLIAVPLAGLTPAAIPNAVAAGVGVHGPPGFKAPGTSSASSTILRM
jgi:hypothetical protein